MPADAALRAAAQQSWRDLMTLLEESSQARRAVERLCASTLAVVAGIEHRDAKPEEARHVGP